MKKIIQFSLLVICVFILTGCGSKRSYLNEISYDEYKKMIEDKETFIVEVMRTECSACQNFKPKLEAVANKYKVEVKYINTDHLTDEEYKELSRNTGLTSTPTVIFYHDGVEKTASSRITSSVSQEKIISKFKISGFIKE